MPLTNVIDRRRKPYRWKRINAVLEPTCHNNEVEGSDQVLGPQPQRSPHPHYFAYEDLEHVTVEAAIHHAQAKAIEVTLYLYDHDDGLYPITLTRIWRYFYQYTKPDKPYS